MSGATVTEPGERAVGKGWWMRRLAATVAATAAVVACSCSGDDDDPPADSTTSSSTTTNAEEEVEAAYLAFAEMGERLLQAPNPDDPEIGERTSGEAQANLIEGLRTLRDANERYELGPSYGHDVLSVQMTDGSGTADVCVVDDSRRVNALTGVVVAEGPTTVEWTVTLLSSDGRWKVDHIVEGEIKEGVVQCDS